MNTPNVEFLNVPLCSARMSYLAGSVGACAHSIGREGCHDHTCVMAIGADFKMYLLPSVLLKSSRNFFYNTQETQTQKMMDQNSEIWFLWFLRIFFKFSKRRRTVPLWPIWTIMVVAKLDHSRVLVTKFHQNRSALKGRSAGQRQTDRQTRLKIRALQVCNRANNRNTNLHIYKQPKYID